MKEKIELMLKVYRARLEKANKPPVDHVVGLQTEAQIGILEMLLIYANEEAAQHSVQRTGLVCTCPGKPTENYIVGSECNVCGLPRR